MVTGFSFAYYFLKFWCVESHFYGRWKTTWRSWIYRVKLLEHSWLIPRVLRPAFVRQNRRCFPRLRQLACCQVNIPELLWKLLWLVMLVYSEYTLECYPSREKVDHSQSQDNSECTHTNSRKSTLFAQRSTRLWQKWETPISGQSSTCRPPKAFWGIGSPFSRNQ